MRLWVLEGRVEDWKDEREREQTEKGGKGRREGEAKNILQSKRRKRRNGEKRQNKMNRF